MGRLSDRRAHSSEKIKLLREELQAAAPFASDRACVYATGSFGRLEAFQHSDLDLFIAGRSRKNEEGDFLEGSELNHLDEVCIQAELIKISRRLGFPEFTGDGRYLDHHSVYEFVNVLGTERDDVTNTFTARLLLLLESRPLLGDAVYNDVVNDVIQSYWRDYDDHRSNFMPAFFANDILRLWRTFCVNYEARTERQPIHKKASGKLKNYKLKHSRLLTCYSALLYLLAIYGLRGTVDPSDALEMTRLTPTERLDWLLNQTQISASHSTIRKLLEEYERFLVATSFEEAVLIERFMDKEQSREHFRAAHEFGDTMFHAISIVGQNSAFHRLLVV